jgi:hypothetical protein
LGSPADLEFLLAQRHTVAALLKHLAAVVATDAATAAQSCGISMPGDVLGSSMLASPSAVADAALAAVSEAEARLQQASRQLPAGAQAGWYTSCGAWKVCALAGFSLCSILGFFICSVDQHQSRNSTHSSMWLAASL